MEKKKKTGRKNYRLSMFRLAAKSQGKKNTWVLFVQLSFGLNFSGHTYIDFMRAVTCVIRLATLVLRMA